MILISAAQVFGAVGTALGTIAVIFYIRAAVGDGTLGRLDIQIESAAEPTTAVIFLTSVVVIIFLAALSIWLSDKAIASLARQHADRLRSMILRLIADPQSENWQDRLGYSRPARELQQILIQRTRSMTVALREVLALGPSFAVLALSLAVALFLDPLAALLLLPFIVVFGIAGERMNRRVQSLTATYETRQERSREVIGGQLEELISNRLRPEQVSLSRASTDDGLFHDRQLESTKLQLLALGNSALLFALTAAFFIIFRGVETLTIERIIIYIFAIRFATSSVRQIVKALAQVSRRFEDIEAIGLLIENLDLQRIENSGRPKPDRPFPEELVIDSPRANGIRIAKGSPVLVLSAEPVTSEQAARLLRTLSAASDRPEVDLCQDARFLVAEPGQTPTDILGSANVRVIISDDPSIDQREIYDGFTFFMHHRPKLLLGVRAQRAAQELGPAFVVKRGEVVWAGSVLDAKNADEHLRGLLGRPNSRKPRYKPRSSGETVSQ